ncbi:MAG: sensor histidine kinase [Candidatus Thiodiazotropha sp. (ex Codakia rugifera)]|nr:sensor histidine kinase [Candidatus Thiodiazotropha sp. (ex Codakia rugifera)]
MTTVFIKSASHSNILSPSSSISTRNLTSHNTSNESENIKNLLEYKQLPLQRINSDEKERKRLSRELHDGLGQMLTTIGLQVKQCLDGYEENHDMGFPVEHKYSLEMISDMVKVAIGEVRSICSAIRPAILDDIGALAAISWQCRQISRACPSLEVDIAFDIDESQIPETYKSVIYRIVQESLNNTVKYSQATSAKVTVLEHNDAIYLSIADNGVGFDQTAIQKKLGLGLMNMRERVESVSGKMEIEAAIDQGVEVRVSFPMAKQ